MTLSPWRWSIPVLLITLVGCQNSSPDSPLAQPPSPGTPEVVQTTAPDSPSALPPSDAEPATPWTTADDLIPLVLARVEEEDLCDGFFDLAVAETESQVYISGDRALVEILCAHAAYQSVYTYLAVSSDATMVPLTLDGFYPDEGGNFQRVSESTVGGLADFDPSQGQLTLFSKARGIGDCGSLATYRWTGQSLDLETYRYQACNDDPNGVQTAPAPEDFPQVYP